MRPGDQERLRQWLAQVGVIGMICLSITAPGIVVSPSLPYFKIEQLLIPIVLAVYIWLLLAGVARTLQFNRMYLVGFVYFICNVISLTYSANVLGHSLVLGDFYELPKVWLPVAFYTIAYEAELSEAALRRLATCFSFAALLVCFYGWGQFAGLGFTHKLNSYYSGGGHIDQALEYARRVYATTGNANELGILMVWCTVIFVLVAIFRIGSRPYYSLVAFACLVTLVMTGSRYGIISLSVGLLLIVALRSFISRRGFAQIAFLLLLLPVVVGTYRIVSSSSPGTLARYQTFENPLQIDSFRDRLDYLWPLAWADFKKSPLFGQGPGKSFLWLGVGRGGAIDSEYLGILRERGIFGLLAFLGYYFYPLYSMSKGLRAARSLTGLRLLRTPANIVVLEASFIMGVLALIMNMGMATFGALFLQGFLWLWLGIGARAAATVGKSFPLSNAPFSVIRPLEPERTSST